MDGSAQTDKAVLETTYSDNGATMSHHDKPAGRKSEGWEPKIVAIVCNWCTYPGADLAGISRIQYPPNVRIIRVPCTGRINPFYIVKALQSGADGVLVSG